MPCFHKFLNYLNLETLDFEPTTLIVGTFNPEWPIGNNAMWFLWKNRKQLLLGLFYQEYIINQA